MGVDIAQVPEDGRAAEVAEENLPHPHRPNQKAQENTQPLFHRENEGIRLRLAGRRIIAEYQPARPHAQVLRAKTRFSSSTA